MKLRRYKAILNDNGDYRTFKVSCDTVEEGYRIVSDKLKFIYGNASVFIELKYDGTTEIKQMVYDKS